MLIRCHSTTLSASSAASDVYRTQLLVGPAMRRMTFPRRKWLTKHVSANCGVGETLVQWGVLIDADCPRCGEEEDATHVWSCKQPEAVERWNSAVEDLAEEMKKQGTPLEVTEASCASLVAWKTGSPMPTIPRRIQGLADAVEEQTKLGWPKFLEGCISKKWRRMMDHYYIRRGSMRSGKLWAIKLVHKLWDVAMDQWKHRNSVLHETDHKLLTQKTDEGIKNIWEEANAITRTIRPRCFNTTTREDVEAQEFCKRKTWLNHAQNMLQRYERKKEQQQEQQG